MENQTATRSQKEDVERNVGNFRKVPSWHTTMSAAQVEYMFENYDTSILCGGRIRNITTDRITDNCFKVYTKKAK